MSTWQQLTIKDFEALRVVKDQFHLGVQNVAAVGRKFLEADKRDENATLVWIPEYGRIAGKWIDAKIMFRSSIGFNDFAVHLVDESVTSISSFELQGKSHGQVMVWLEEQIALFGLDTSQLVLNLPYDLPEYLTSVGKPFAIEDMSLSQELGKYFHNGQLIAEEVKTAFNSSEVRCWPHHFDISTQITVNNTGNPETSSYVSVGLSPGDDEFPEPYFFASPWPYPPVEELPKLTHGKWVDENWVGAVLSAPELLEKEDQYKSVRRFMSESFTVFRKLMTY
ncbi:MAG: hypothetical protein RIF33_19125 [Cyclobacteriaceae bacterium]